MLNYTVRALRGEPRFDALGVLKLCCESDVPVNDRIFAQAQLGRNETTLFARIWSFETAPTPASQALLTLRAGGHTLALTTRFDGVAEATLDGGPCPAPMTSYILQGEDLQGEYWGAVLLLPLQKLNALLGLRLGEQETVLSANVARACPGYSSAVPKEEWLTLTVQ